MKSQMQVCENCLQPWGDHDPGCPYGPAPSWQRDEEPARRAREEDRLWQDQIDEDLWP
jgi:hypothetical protein